MVLVDIVGGKLVLDWLICKCIVFGVVWGLFYLYEYCDLKIIYWDVKVVNILFDEGYEVVVGDFGFVKLLDYWNFYVIIVVWGIVGYIVLEYFFIG